MNYIVIILNYIIIVVVFVVVVVVIPRLAVKVLVLGALRVGDDGLSLLYYNFKSLYYHYNYN